MLLALITTIAISQRSVHANVSSASESSGRAFSGDAASEGLAALTLKSWVVAGRVELT